MRLLEQIQSGTLDERLSRRIASLFITFFALFYLSVLLSFLLLPDGFLRGKHPLTSSWTTSPNLWISTLQIFGYNLVPTAVVVGGNLFSVPSRLVGGHSLPQGYLGLWCLALLTGAYLGSWSFEVETPAPPFWQRLAHPLDIVHHSGFIELSAYILAAAASARWARFRVQPDGRTIRGYPSVAPGERLVLLLAMLLLLAGALVESRAILEVTAQAGI